MRWIASLRSQRRGGARNDGVEFAMTRFCLCEERSDVALCNGWLGICAKIYAIHSSYKDQILCLSSLVLKT